MSSIPGALTGLTSGAGRAPNPGRYADMIEQPQHNAPDSEQVTSVAGAPQRPPTPTREQLAARRQYRRAIRRSRNPLYIPLTWLVAAALLVLIALAGVIAALVGLRQDSAAAPLEPVIVVATAQAGDSDGASSDDESAPLASTPASGPQIILAAETPASLALTGPPVPTVIVTNTPIPLAVGVQARVYNVGSDELNVRNIPSINNSEILFRAAAGTVFNVIGGPQEADGFSWWQLHDPQFEVIGWAVANYLQTVSENPG